MAIQYYQKSISTLIKLTKLYPTYNLNKLYIDRATAFQQRIDALSSAHGYSLMEPQSENEIGPEPQKDRSNSPQVVQSLKASYDELIIQEKPNVSWDDVVGLEETKKALRESIIFPIQRPDLFPLGWPRGILLYGPPGCGKTLLAAATATEIDGQFMTVDAASIMSKWLGDAEKNVAKLFNKGRELLNNGAPSVIIFIDELDSLLGSRNQDVGGEIRVRNQFLKEMDGIMDKGKNVHMYIVGATNKPWALDWPFLRRFQRRVYVKLPNQEARINMFADHTASIKLDSDIKLEDLADITDGYSGSDIKDVCQSVQIKVVSELFDKGDASDKEAQPRHITINDFKEVLKNRRPSVSGEMIQAYIQWSENYKAL